jgi:anti-anti-sigma regulatory factor
MTSELLIGHIPDGFVLRVVGHGTLHESVAFRSVAESKLDSGLVVFDATQCEYLDSTFLGCLIGIQKACEQSPTRRFVIAASNATRIKLFSTSSLDQYFDFVDICPQVLDELKPVDIQEVDRAILGRHVMRCHQGLADRGGHEANAFRSIADRLAKELGESTPQ